MCKDNWLTPHEEMEDALADIGEEPPHGKIYKIVITKESLEKLWNILFKQKGDKNEYTGCDKDS